MQFTAVTLIFLLLSPCGYTKPLEVLIDQEFDLKFQASALVQSEGFTIQFKSLLQDSRCPKGEQCITQGNASIELQLSRAEKEVETFQLNTDSVPNEADYGKYKIKLISLTPYPRSGEKSDSNQYIATLLITTH